MLTKQIRRTQRVHFRGMAARVLDIGCQISEFLRCPQKVHQKRIVLFQLLVFNFYADSEDILMTIYQNFTKVRIKPYFLETLLRYTATNRYIGCNSSCKYQMERIYRHIRVHENN